MKISEKRKKQKFIVWETFRVLDEVLQDDYDDDVRGRETPLDLGPSAIST